MIAKLTQYGYANDPYADSLTEAGWGAWDNKLTPTSCALTASLAKALGATPKCTLRIDLGNGKFLFREYDDKAPESDLRCDLYMPAGYDNSLPDFADVTLN